MSNGERSTYTATRGFSMVELLVVLLILGILVSIAIPTMLATAPERNLAAAGDRFANDMNYARAKAEATGNNVFVGFIYRPDERQIEGYWDFDATNPVPSTPVSTANGTSFNVPPNPGISRVCKEYFVVEERPRWNFDGSAYTYLDWLTAYDAYDDTDNDPPYPVEPMFPYDALETASSGYLPDPTLGPFNAVAAPLINHTLDLYDTSGGNAYEPLHIANRPLYGDWIDGEEYDQARKVFCIADEEEILALDRNFTSNGERTYDPTGSTPDHPRLEDQVIDYVLLKRVKLPEYVYFMNPWKDQWVVGYDSQGRFTQNMQFLQYLWEFKPDGQIAQAQWTMDPEPFPDGTYDNLFHGVVSEIDSLPTVRPFWMVLEECVDFGAGVDEFGTNLPGSTAILQNNRKTNVASSARMFTLWSLNGKYYVDDYTPNDSARHLAVDDPRLNLDENVNSGGTLGMQDNRTTTEYSALVAREFGYSQDFLFPNPVQN